jgi:hypothetical protein
MAMGFTACSSDDTLESTEVQDEGNIAYMTVKIQTPNDGVTRSAANPDTEDFEDGEETEYAVGDVKFYFFNSKGKFITKGSLWKTKTENEWQKNTADENITLFQLSVVSVPHYNEENKPAMMITVVNPPSDLTLSEGEDISKVYEKTTQYLENQNKETGALSGNFVMTTTSYYDKTASQQQKTYFYTTDLTSHTFYKTVKEAEADNADVVDVYVERLACKVNVDFSDDVEKASKKLYSGVEDVMFKLGNFDLNSDESDGKETTLYARFIGWGINGTDKASFYSKHIENTWSDNMFGNVMWTDVARHRSYWAESVNYISEAVSSGYFPQRFAQKNSTDVNANGYYNGFKEDYISGNDMQKRPYGTAQYCNETTQSTAALSSTDVHLPGAVAHALILAQLTDENGNALKDDVAKFSGEYMWATTLKERFINRVFEDNVPLVNGNKLTVNDVEFVTDSDKWNGEVNLHLTSKAAGSSLSTGEGTAITADDINAAFESYKGSQILYLYRNGYMYYYSLIRHLNPTLTSNNAINEGYYGLVRNHVYYLTLEGFSTYDENGDPKVDENGDPLDPVGPKGPDDPDDPIDPGHAIEDPNEPIIPNVEEDTNYYIGAKINILSWRIVSHKVAL